jgi:putative transposase
LIKRGFSRDLPAGPARTPGKIAKRERGLWQRRFWEHVIRDDADLERHIHYIISTRSSMGWSNAPAIGHKRYVAREILPPDWGGDLGE